MPTMPVASMVDDDTPRFGKKTVPRLIAAVDAAMRHPGSPHEDVEGEDRFGAALLATASRCRPAASAIDVAPMNSPGPRSALAEGRHVAHNLYRIALPPA
jgi:hypothetical protein